MRSRHIATLTLALCLGLAPVGAAMAQEARQPLDRIVAVVNEGAIMNSQLEDRVARTRAQLESQACRCRRMTCCVSGCSTGWSSRRSSCRWRGKPISAWTIPSSTVRCGPSPRTMA